MTNRESASMFVFMWRTRKFCFMLDTCIKRRSLDQYVAEYRILFRKGAKREEIIEWAAKKGETITEEDIRDLIRAEFFEAIVITPNYTGIEIITLGRKGRNLLRKSFIERWAYFFQYGFEEHSNIYTLVIGGGIATIVIFFFGLVKHVWQFLAHSVLILHL